MWFSTCGAIYGGLLSLVPHAILLLGALQRPGAGEESRNVAVAVTEREVAMTVKIDKNRKDCGSPAVLSFWGGNWFHAVSWIPPRNRCHPFNLQPTWDRLARTRSQSYGDRFWCKLCKVVDEIQSVLTAAWNLMELGPTAP